MKKIISMLGFAFGISGWIVAALCLHVVRTPDVNNPTKSVLVVIPKDRLRIADTYVDARQWTMADVPAHRGLVLRMIYADKANQLQFLADPNSREDIETQLTEALGNSKDDGNYRRASTAKSSSRMGGFFFGKSGERTEVLPSGDRPEEAGFFDGIDWKSWADVKFSF
jgi:hypothetical protein